MSLLRQENEPSGLMNEQLEVISKDADFDNIVDVTLEEEIEEMKKVFDEIIAEENFVAENVIKSFDFFKKEGGISEQYSANDIRFNPKNALIIMRSQMHDAYYQISPDLVSQTVAEALRAVCENDSIDETGKDAERNPLTRMPYKLRLKSLKNKGISFKVLKKLPMMTYFIMKTE